MVYKSLQLLRVECRLPPLVPARTRPAIRHETAARTPRPHPPRVHAPPPATAKPPPHATAASAARPRAPTSHREIAGRPQRPPSHACPRAPTPRGWGRAGRTRTPGRRTRYSSPRGRPWLPGGGRSRSLSACSDGFSCLREARWKTGMEGR
jgi:hypothetical protein